MAENEEESQRVLIGKRCYVGSLAWKTSWQDLKDKFRDCGSVVYTNVMRNELGRSKGWGIVEFETPEEALHAINTMNGLELHGRRILVREDREDRDVKNYIGTTDGENAPKREGGRGRGRGGRRGGRGRGRAASERKTEEQTGQSSGLQIVVQGIPWAWTSSELQEKFTPLGEIVGAEIATGFQGRSRGYGTVKFATKEAASQAVTDVNGTDLEGRRLHVFLDRYA